MLRTYVNDIFVLIKNGFAFFYYTAIMLYFFILCRVYRFLRDDWVGYPLRKDYDESLNPLRMTNEEPVDTTQYIEVQHVGSVIEKRETIFVEDLC